jgi:glycerophosphoryl diester phosphodiesterase
MSFARTCLLVLASILIFAGPAYAADDSGVRVRFGNSGPSMIVVAHRGCHNAAPHHGLTAVPENSIAALNHCVKLGADMMELDVRRSAGGELIIIHDETLDRTTTGKGRVSELSLAELKRLRLLDNMGGKGARPTDLSMSTLQEMLEAARGRILLNLDVKDAIYAETIDAVARAGMTDQVIVKTSAGPSTQPLAAMQPYDRVPFGVVLMNANGTADLAAIARRQVEGAHPIMLELPEMSPSQLPGVIDVARKAGVRIWTNTLWQGFITEWGGDIDALRYPEQIWGRMHDAGITVFQTDEPEALIAFRDRCCTARRGTGSGQG